MARQKEWSPEELFTAGDGASGCWREGGKARVYVDGKLVSETHEALRPTRIVMNRASTPEEIARTEEWIAASDGIDDRMDVSGPGDSFWTLYLGRRSIYG